MKRQWFSYILSVLTILPLSFLCLEHEKPSQSKLTDNTQFKPDWSVLNFGAQCDGKTDDTKAFRQALLQSQLTHPKHTGILHIPGSVCKISGTIEIPPHVVLQGEGRFSTVLFVDATEGTLLRIGGAGGSIKDLDIKYSHPPQKGIAIDAASTKPMLAQIINVMIENPYIGIDLSGNSIDVDHIRINGSSYIGVRIGHQTQHADTVDPRVTNSTIASTNTALAGMLIEDAGGLYLENNDVLYGKIGTYFSAGDNQQILWTFANNTVLADTSIDVGLRIDARYKNSIIKGLNFSNSWSSNIQNGPGIAQYNMNNSDESLFNFSNMRVFTVGQDAFHFQGSLVGLSLQNNVMCGNNKNSTSIYIGNNMKDYNISDNNLSYHCGGWNYNNSTGITILENSENGIIKYNNFSGIPFPINLKNKNMSKNLIFRDNIQK
ncbi:right-handed parallel beta-helix repeat-containing protein [Acetobacter orientalis]|uniref:Pectate lyase superfamily protein domain-containing protein n=1 Tax=Acetobacter orientalis TaxID=146474 RepID=A0A0D6NK19_9PROT|nr:glycosyl hydrolase family 28-related protein [Acetobacter orientalis]GAN65943.1 hypothetical protein Abor_014_108 [Acetobacter orientalis]GBR20169.1 hypothetical protein AA0481_2053 [Acetobacter orientalis NRIC 0481]GEL60383.1 hypothetical protein AOR02nite_02250 [Acetobacter orientalis]